MTFAEAIKTPKGGWSKANEEQLLAFLSNTLGRHCCLRPEAVFDWAKKHSSYTDLVRAARRLTRNVGDMELLEAVLNDQPLKK